MKRILTDDERAAQRSSQFQASTCTPDLAATIRAASMRARKTVTEGYLSPPPSSLVKQAPVALTGPLDYPFSARESIRQVFSSLPATYSPLPSPSKRKLPHPDPHDHDDQSITPFFATPQSQDRPNLAAELSGDDMDVDRPVKPLRRSRRIREVTPTPSWFPSETEMNSQSHQVSTSMPST